MALSEKDDYDSEQQLLQYGHPKSQPSRKSCQTGKLLTLVFFICSLAMVTISLILPRGSPRQTIDQSDMARSKSSANLDEDLVNLVDITTGSGPARFDFSRGNTLPLIALPHAMTHWAVQTLPSSDLSSKWFFDPSEVKFGGVRCTHQPSPWIGDYGQFIIAAGIDELGSAVYDRVKGATMKPHLLNTTFLNMCSYDGCVRMEFAPSEHGGILRVRFPPSLGKYRQHLTIQLSKGSINTTISSTHSLRESNEQEPLLGNPRADPSYNSYFLAGFSTANAGGVVSSKNFKHHFVHAIRFLGGGAQGLSVDTDIQCITSCSATLSWNNTNLDKEVIVEMRIGTSFISQSQAELALHQEIANFTLEEVSKRAQHAWNLLLSRVHVRGEAKSSVHDQLTAKRMLYTNLYRALLFPRYFAEINASNETVHYSPFSADGSIRPGAVMVDSGFWDAYRTVYPMLHLFYPDIAERILKAYVNSLDESGGRIVQWASPGPRDSMVGTMSDVTLAEGIVKGALKDEDAKKAYASLLMSAFDKNGSNSRAFLDEYTELGYIPQHTALTLNYKLADFSIAQAAVSMNDTDTADQLLRRSQDWLRLFDNETRFFRAPGSDGAFPSNFDPFLWDLEDTTEGSFWHYRFYVPHDGARLRTVHAALGGEGSLCAALRSVFATPPAFHMRNVIHEAVEFASNCVGQYAQNNQPAHHMLYMFAHSECPLDGQNWIAYTLDHQYSMDGYSGDEDNGEMASWYLLSSIGLYALNPSSGTYQVGTGPVFEQVEITRPIGYGDTLRISRPSKAEAPYRWISFNDYDYDLSNDVVQIHYHDLLKGGHILFS